MSYYLFMNRSTNGEQYAEFPKKKRKNSTDLPPIRFWLLPKMGTGLPSLRSQPPQTGTSHRPQLSSNFTFVSRILYESFVFVRTNN